jgi:hypothetical protein
VGIARLIGTDRHRDAWVPGALRRVAVVRMQVRSRRGWKQVTAMQQATGSAMLAFEKEQRHVALSFNRNRQGEGTVVSVQVQDDAKR